MDLDVNDVKIAVVLALPKEAAGAAIIFAEQDESYEIGVEPGFSSSLCRIPSLNGLDYHTIALAIPTMTGNNHSAICVTQLRSIFENLQHVILCGIAGGTPTPGNHERDVHLGDIVVACKDGMLQHDFGHDIYPPECDYLLDKSNRIYMPSEIFENINNSLKRQYVLGNSPWVDKLNERLPKLTKINTEFSRPTVDINTSNYDQLNNGVIKQITRIPKYDYPKVFYGGIASGNCVLKNPFRRDKLRDKHRILAVEMEAAGLAAACNPMHLDYTVVRGICDYCDSNKNDDWQCYAAAAAAAYSYSIIERIPLEQQRTHTLNGKIEGDYSSIERIDLQAVQHGAPSASAHTGLELMASTSDTAVTTTKPTEGELEVRQYLQEMEDVSAQHDWENLYKIAASLENTLDLNSNNIKESVYAEGLYEVARAYSTWSQINKNGTSGELAAHAAQLAKRAMEILE